MASLAALGARRSSHSGITGAPEGSVDLGVRKEAACRQLAQQAVDLTVSCKLLEDPSQEAREVASVLRVTLFGKSPP